MNVRLQRFPLVTGLVFAVTAAVNVSQFVSAGLLHHLERTPAGLHGDWWRSVTSLFVQDGGVYGTVSNLAFLLVLGVVAEQVVSRPRWLMLYFGAGLVGELAGYAWQPTGGGNSVAICGLAGAVAVAVWLRERRLPAFAPTALLVWCGALLATWWFPLILVGVIAGSAVQKRVQNGDTSLLRAAAIAAPLTGIVLCAATNIHGAALLAGVALATVALHAATRVATPQPSK